MDTLRKVLQEDMSCTCSGEVRTLLREQLQSEEGGLASMGQVDTIFEEWQPCFEFLDTQIGWLQEGRPLISSMLPEEDAQNGHTELRTYDEPVLRKRARVFQGLQDCTWRGAALRYMWLVQGPGLLSDIARFAIEEKWLLCDGKTPDRTLFTQIFEEMKHESTCLFRRWNPPLEINGRKLLFGPSQHFNPIILFGPQLVRNTKHKTTQRCQPRAAPSYLLQPAMSAHVNSTTVGQVKKAASSSSRSKGAARTCSVAEGEANAIVSVDPSAVKRTASGSRGRPSSGGGTRLKRTSSQQQGQGYALLQHPLLTMDELRVDASAPVVAASPSRKRHHHASNGTAAAESRAPSARKNAGPASLPVQYTGHVVDNDQDVVLSPSHRQQRHDRRQHLAHFSSSSSFSEEFADAAMDVFEVADAVADACAHSGLSIHLDDPHSAYHSPTVFSPSRKTLLFGFPSTGFRHTSSHAADQCLPLWEKRTPSSGAAILQTPVLGGAGESCSPSAHPSPGTWTAAAAAAGVAGSPSASARVVTNSTGGGTSVSPTGALSSPGVLRISRTISPTHLPSLEEMEVERRHPGELLSPCSPAPPPEVVDVECEGQGGGDEEKVPRHRPQPVHTSCSSNHQSKSPDTLDCGRSGHEAGPCGNEGCCARFVNCCLCGKGPAECGSMVKHPHFPSLNMYMCEGCSLTVAKLDAAEAMFEEERGLEGLPFHSPCSVCGTSAEREESDLMLGYRDWLQCFNCSRAICGLCMYACFPPMAAEAIHQESELWACPECRKKGLDQPCGVLRHGSHPERGMSRQCLFDRYIFQEIPKFGQRLEESRCFDCKQQGNLIPCDHPGCTKVYHSNCNGCRGTLENWTCSRHRCAHCTRQSPTYQCVTCPTSYCTKHFPADALDLATIPQASVSRKGHILCGSCLAMFKMTCIQHRFVGGPWLLSHLPEPTPRPRSTSHRKKKSVDVSSPDQGPPKKRKGRPPKRAVATDAAAASAASLLENTIASKQVDGSDGASTTAPNASVLPEPSSGVPGGDNNNINKNSTDVNCSTVAAASRALCFSLHNTEHSQSLSSMSPLPGTSSPSPPPSALLSESPPSTFLTENEWHKSVSLPLLALEDRHDHGGGLDSLFAAHT